MTNRRRKGGPGEGFPKFFFFLLGDSLLPHPSRRSFQGFGLRLQGMQGPYFCFLEVYSRKRFFHLSLSCCVQACLEANLCSCPASPRLPSPPSASREMAMGTLYTSVAPTSLVLLIEGIRKAQEGKCPTEGHMPGQPETEWRPLLLF